MIKDGKFRDGLTSESVCVSESLNIYAWIVKAQCDMDKRYGITKLRIIFGDDFLQQLLITSLAITETCTLRWDYYHQMK